MQISGVIPILLNIILSEQQNQKQAPREEQAAGKTIARPHPPPSTAADAEAAAPRHRTAENSEPVLLPLPLKSPLFPDAQFFAFRRAEDDQNRGRDGKKEIGIIFSLSTRSLGRLFFTLTRQAETINIFCHTENEKISARLAPRWDELKQQLQQTGFPNVTIRCTALHHNFRPLQAGYASPGLLDRKV
ncbi:hypothetical protein [Desulfoscipio geothermicus]|uniref:Hook-length control protein FliK n=1 Tax=Desulfoscipio geothermicus DSM 3669 TaxID=1121426 RepID=A0A1I6DI86_9FIRM|nr:hypothetical protein [Desulfoscipio geothermicus]SFR05052.1 hypothetical protein SAMN05660706_11144 [Desulfoscipio geothermicus DSM 3669]